jgi:HD-like signal output (HDOD) protein
MEEKSIVEMIEERMEKGGVDLPIFHRVALTVQRMFSDNNYHVSEVATVIKRDQALASEILRLSNSAFYGGLQPIQTVHDAIVRLGAKSIINLVMVATQRESYRFQLKELQVWMTPLWRHSLGTAVAAKWLAMNIGLNKISEEAFLAGLLHDIGKLFLLKILEDLGKNDLLQEKIEKSIIRDILQGLHCEKGEHLMVHMNMPKIYCETVASHHDPSKYEENAVINIVSLANQTCHKLGIGMNHNPGLMLSTTPEAISLMVSDLMLAELQVYLEDYVMNSM